MTLKARFAKIASVRLLGRSVPVRLKEMSSTMWGCYDGDSEAILVNPECPLYRARETVLHELIHAIDGDLSLKLRERQVRSLSRVLYPALFIDNPCLLAFLAGK